MSGSHDPPGANPFSAARVRPGQIGYMFPEEQSASRLIHRLQSHNWWGQIVGPHGSGKSALLAELIPAIAGAGRESILVELHDGARRLPFRLGDAVPPGKPAVVIVDGYEQLSAWNRLLLRRFCRRRGLGLLVTSHRSMGFPDLARTATGLAGAQRIVDGLLGARPECIAPDEVADRFTARDGNIREMLFDLYDLYEQRRCGA